MIPYGHGSRTVAAARHRAGDGERRLMQLRSSDFAGRRRHSAAAHGDAAAAAKTVPRHCAGAARRTAREVVCLIDARPGRADSGRLLSLGRLQLPGSDATSSSPMPSLPPTSSARRPPAKRILRPVPAAGTGASLHLHALRARRRRVSHADSPLTARATRRPHRGPHLARAVLGRHRSPPLGPHRPNVECARAMDEVNIKVRESGPYLVRGDVTLTDADGNSYTVEGENIALCRCGGSQTKPFCDGSHKKTVLLRRSARRDRERERRRCRHTCAKARYRISGTSNFAAPTEGLYAEELFSTKGLRERLLPALPPPSADGDARRAAVGPPRDYVYRQRAAAQPASQDAALRLRERIPSNRARRCSATTTSSSPSRTRERPMEYFYRNTGGDELLFIHHGAGVIETQFGELAYREHDYLVIPTGTTYRVTPSAPTRMLVYESTGAVTIPRRYRNEFGQLEEHAPYYERDFRAPVLKAPVEAQGEYEVRVTNGGAQRDLHRAESSVRRDRLGRLLLSVCVQSRRVRADHRQAAPASARACDLRSARRRVLRVRPAPLRLPSAGDSRAVQSFERRLRRSALLRQRQFHEPPRR